MDPSENFLRNLINKQNIKTLPSFLDHLDSILSYERTEYTNIIKFMKEIMFCQSKASLFFGKTLEDLRCVISVNSRQHEMWIKYNGPKKLLIGNVELPQPSIENQVFESLEDAINVFMMHVNELNNYFDQLDQIQQFCVIVEPVRPTYKENYRKIHLADRIWLHVEVAHDGSARPHLSQFGQQNQKLQDLLLAWDHDKDIASNVEIIVRQLNNADYKTPQPEMTQQCGICYCTELDEGPNTSGSVPQPFCNNKNCGVYYHRTCLYMSLMHSQGGLPTPFGFVNGKCPNPTCLQPIMCSEKDV